jgi:hypothetical protein
MTLNVTVHDSTITVPGGRSAKVANLALPIGIRGSLGSPMIRIDGEALASALAAAGASQLAADMRGKVDEEVDKAKEKVEEKAKGIIGNILGGGGDRK